LPLWAVFPLLKIVVVVEGAFEDKKKKKKISKEGNRTQGQKWEEQTDAWYAMATYHQKVSLANWCLVALSFSRESPLRRKGSALLSPHAHPR
jgi:hypothetical protein